MDADWSVELGRDDPALEFPWSSTDGSQCFVNLLRDSEAITQVPEAVQYPELSNFLLSINAPSGHWLTAKCDVFFDDQLGEAEAIYEANLKMGSYVDLVGRDANARFSFARHEAWAKSAARALSSDDEMPIDCEFIVRRCWYHPDADDRMQQRSTDLDRADELQAGFYLTSYLFGYGNVEAQTRARWGEGLRRVTAVLLTLDP